MTTLDADELRIVMGGVASEVEGTPPQPMGERTRDREIERIQRDNPMEGRPGAVQEWNRRMEDYRQNERQRNSPGRYFEWLHKQPIG